MTTTSTVFAAMNVHLVVEISRIGVANPPLSRGLALIIVGMPYNLRLVPKNLSSQSTKLGFPDGN